MESISQKGPGLYEFLVEAELQHYYTSIKSDLKIQNTSQLKYVTDDDYYQLGMSKPEVRRLKKYFNKYYPQNYLSKFKKMLLPKKDDQGATCLMPSSICDPSENSQHDRVNSSGNGPRVPNKHIISAENIVVNKELGMGEFGVVQQGVWTNDGDRIQVAIKCLSRERMQNNPIEFLKEAAIMHSIDHEHVVRLYGVVLHTDSLMLVTELAPLRSLLECLKEPSLRASFPVLTLCDFALQICDGMQYLEAKRLIHRDLAARNILVFSKNKVKISDFGLSRALGQGKDYYQTNFNVHLKLPIAWCAPECISYLRFTSASDVWAYGVTLWEMFSYGFQPWAALTGHQILEAIDEPNFQRLDQPECCPKDYFTIMLRCWAHEPNKRPTFAELMSMLPECRPEQLQAIMNTPLEFTNQLPPDTNSPPSQPFFKREYLQYKIGDVITVLDKGSGSDLWKGILANGKSGLFNPAHTVAYIGTNLPTSNKPDIFSRSDNKYGSTRRKLRTEMISSPQGDLKHTGHVGLDGTYFGDFSFLGGSSSDEKHSTIPQYNHLPRQIVTPYRPHEDLDQTPLLSTSANSNTFITPNTPPPSSHVTSSTTTVSSHSNLHASDHIVVSSRQLQHLSGPPGTETNLLTSNHLPSRNPWSKHEVNNDSQADHEYHEISDEENLVNESPRFEKSFDFGPSLLDEMESMFRNLNSPVLSTPNSPLDHDGVNKCNELRELTSRLGSTNISSNHSHHSSTRNKKQATVKPISAHDQKILDSAIELATEMTARSMNDLDGEALSATPASPNKRKFSFRFPATGGGSTEVDGSKAERRNFSEEAHSIPDLQSTLTEEAQLAYESLVETPTPTPDTVMTSPHFMRHSTMDNPLRMLRSGNLPLIKPRIRTVATLPPPASTKLINNRVKKIEKLKQMEIHQDCIDGLEIDVDDDVFVENKEVVYNPKQQQCSSISDESNCGDHFRDDNIKEMPPSYSEFQHQRDEHNPIPLPPRDRTKPKPAVKPRHTRKHPLIIPASSIQRTLNKVNVITPEDSKQLDFSENPIQIIPDGKIRIEQPSYINHNPFKVENVEDREFDTHSIHFETQIESALDNDIILSASPTENDFHHIDNTFSIDTIDGSSNFQTNFDQQETKIFANNKIIDYTTKSRDKKSDKLNKIPNNVNESGDTLRHRKDHVSCEDLLEFADSKPSSRARGIESDEVRIMSKVLGTEVSTQQCLLALEHSNWDVHKAIKLAKLQTLLRITLSASNPFVDLSTCNGALEANQWDLSRAASWVVAAANQEGDITQV